MADNFSSSTKQSRFLYFDYANTEKVMSRSTSEAEYRSIADAICEVLWITSLLKEMHIFTVGLPTIWCDNSGAVAMPINPVLHARTKHVEMDLHFIREKVCEGKLQVNYVPAIDQVGDILTKALPVTNFTHLRQKLCVVTPAEICSTSINDSYYSTDTEKEQQ